MKRLSELKLAIENVLQMLRYAKFENSEMDDMCKVYENDLKREKDKLTELIRLLNS